MMGLSVEGTTMLASTCCVRRGVGASHNCIKESISKLMCHHKLLYLHVIPSSLSIYIATRARAVSVPHPLRREGLAPRLEEGK